MKDTIRLVKNIEWESIEKDNMEYQSKRISVYQLDAFKKLIQIVENLYATNEAKPV